MTWLITGGAGYIGAHVADKFLLSGKNIIIYDSLKSGLESRVEYLRKKYRRKIDLIIGDVRDYSSIEDVFIKNDIYGVVHAAGLKSVTESMENKDEYMDVNYCATKAIIQFAIKYKVRNFIFSSTAAVYGAPKQLFAIKEDDVLNPISPYGSSKLYAEKEVSRFLHIPGNRGSSLRFFNVIGTKAQELTDKSIDNLVPIIVEKLLSKVPVEIYGADYPTPDGTCVRDYVDVRDIASVINLIASSNVTVPPILNVGTGYGVSVKEMIEKVALAANRDKIETINSPRRLGDVAILTADVHLAQSELGFNTQYGTIDSIKSILTP
jgi:UDP-glucose 4-epimerase